MMAPTVYSRNPLERMLAQLDRALTIMLVTAMAMMVGVVSAQVVLRYGFNRSIDWADEISRLSFVWAIFLALPLGVRQGAHIGIDLMVNQFNASVQDKIRRAGALVCALLMGAIAWAGVGVALEQWDELMNTVDLSVGWFIVPVVLGAALSCLHFLKITWQGWPMPQVGSAE